MNTPLTDKLMQWRCRAAAVDYPEDGMLGYCRINLWGGAAIVILQSQMPPGEHSHKISFDWQPWSAMPDWMKALVEVELNKNEDDRTCEPDNSKRAMKKRAPKIPKGEVVNYPGKVIVSQRLEDLPPERRARFEKLAHEQHPNLFPKP